jgi:hypothetical protein
MQNWWLLCGEIDNKFMSYYMYTICFVRLYGLDVSESENAVGFLYIPVVDVGWCQDLRRLLHEGKGVAICWAVRPDAAWRATNCASV